VYFKTKRIEKLTVIITLIVIATGGLSLLTQDGVFFKLSPVISELIILPLFFMKDKAGEPLMLQMAKQMNPNAFANPNPEMHERMRHMYRALGFQMAFVIVIHCLIMTWAAFKSTTTVWIFWKGVGFFVLFGIWFFGFYIYTRMLRKKSQQ
jgi:intracellular septation protein